MTKANRDRGVLTERMTAKYLREHGFGNAERAVKTGMRTIDREVADPGDITGTPGLVWQVKALKPLTAAENKVPSWMHETERQRVDAGADLGVLVVRRDQRDAAEWFAFLPLADLYALRGVTGPNVLGIPSPDRLVILSVVARLFLGDLVTLLRACGYGDALTEPVQPAIPPRLEALP